MGFSWKSVANLTLGVNYRNLVASRTSLPGEAQDALNVYPREDGAIYKGLGWIRRNPTALTGKPLACRGFTYRGKNTEGGDTRPGNLGLPNVPAVGAEFTRREAEYPGFLVLTSTTAYVWDPGTEAFIEVDPAAQPQGFVVDAHTKPSIEVVQDNCYVVGWATVNLRFDPVDRLWYRWGWEEVPVAPTLTPIEGDLIGGARYEYGVSFQDNYTGEESKMSDISDIKIASGGGGTNVDVSASSYTGDRHNVNDINLVVWRTGADDKSPRFLDVLLPGATPAEVIDDGLARQTSLRPFQGVQVDEPRLSSLKLFKGKFYGLSKTENSHRVYSSDFDKVNFFERWRILSFRDLEVPEGEVLTAIGGTDATMLVFSQRGCFRANVSVSATRMTTGFSRLPWHVGAVGPRARFTVDGWEYFLTERGPFRWKEGLTAPQNIGENLLPIFVDPTSGLCKLNAKGKEKSEVVFDWTTNTVVWTFALGDSEEVNTHIRYWIESLRINNDYTFGWFPASPDIQAMDLSSSLVGFDGGFPESPREKKEEIIWCDTEGYVYEYLLGGKRGGLDAAEVARTTAIDPITATQITVADAVLDGSGPGSDGLKGLRLEIESAPDPTTGLTTTEVYTIDSSTANTIDVATDFDRLPQDGDAVRIAGIPAFWRSWFDHFGQPHQHKSMMDFSLGYQDRNNPDGTIDIGIGAGEFPTTFSRLSSAGMGKYRKKFTVGKTAAFFMYEFSNSFPDELFLITDFDREIELVRGRRKA